MDNSKAKTAMAGTKSAAAPRRYLVESLGPDLAGRLVLDEYGEAASCVENAATMLDYPSFGCFLCFDEVTGIVIKVGPLPWDFVTDGRDMMGTDVWMAAHWMYGLGVRVDEEHVKAAFDVVARRHPVRAVRYAGRHKRLVRLPYYTSRSAPTGDDNVHEFLRRKRDAQADPSRAAVYGRSKAIIRFAKSELPRVVDESEAALIASGIDLFQRGDVIVRPSREIVPAADKRKTHSWRLIEATPPHVREQMMRAADYVRFDLDSKKYVPYECPESVVKMYCARTGFFKLPLIAGVITAPTLRPDGSLLDRPGYDAETALLLVTSGQAFPPAPAEPSYEEAKCALAFLDGLLDEVPFVTTVDRSVMLAALLTAPVRRSLPVAPLFVFTSPVRGSGKSYLVDLLSLLMTGEIAAVVAQDEKKDEETAKRFDAALLAGDGLISIDNCRRELKGGWLETAASQPLLKIRSFGHLDNVTVANSAMLCATGNQMEIGGDMDRRCLFCWIDHGLERPEERVYSHRPDQMIRDNRGAYVVAALTVLRGFICAGRPAKLVPYEGYGAWNDLVRGALVWLGRPDPVKSKAASSGADVARNRASAVFKTWSAALHSESVSVRQLVKAAADHEELRDALMEVAGKDGRINEWKLAWWLRKNRDRIIAGLKLVQDPEEYDLPRWLIMAAPAMEH